MASLLLVLTLASGSYLSEALSQASKPQTRATKQHIPLPEVTDMTHGSQQVMDELSTQVSSLQDRLNQVHEKGKDALQKQKATYEQTLFLQGRDNAAVKKQNEAIQAAIDRHRTRSANSRMKADLLAGTCQKLKGDLQELQANMTLAREFAQQTLNTTTAMLDAPEMEVLEELDQEDELSKKDALHRFRLTEIAGEEENVVAMFQLATSSKDAPHDMLQSLMTSIEELSRQQNQSFQGMKANFDMAYQKGVEVHDILLEEQKKLNATRDYEEHLDDRLAQAVEHLIRTRDELSHKLSALRVFHARLGGGGGITVQQDASAVSLLQTGQKTLPEVSTLIKDPKRVLKTLSSQISDLEAGLAEKDQESKQAIKQLKADYESQLEAQENENKRIKRMNKQLGKRANDLHDNNVALRATGLDLEAQCAGLESDLKALRSNISTAQEFAALALSKSGAMLDNASELQVLNELDEKDAAERNNRLHQEQLQQVAKIPSFLQVSAASAKDQKQPEELLQSLMASLNDLSQEQNVSEASLKASFEQEFQDGEKKHQALLEEQATIQATIAAGEALHEKLIEAVEHLKATRDGQLERLRSLRSFAKKMAGAEGTGRSLALLQLGAARHSPAHTHAALPGVSKVLEQPTEVYKMMNSHVDQLGQRLAEVEAQTAAEVTKQKAEYERQLQEQVNENKEIKAANLKLAADIEAVKEVSAGLRTSAKLLTTRNEKLRNDLEILQKNMTSAQEFSSLALQAADASLFNASELSVLSELDAADAAHSHEAEHAHQLSAVANFRKLGLLELGATRGATVDPQDMLQQLLASLGDLAKEQNASTEALKATFEQEFQKGADRRTKLLKEQEELNGTMIAETELRERLKAAVNHLKETGSDLEKQTESIRSFLGKLGSRPEASEPAKTQSKLESKPISLASTGKAEAKPNEKKQSPRSIEQLVVENPDAKARSEQKIEKQKENPAQHAKASPTKHAKKVIHEKRVKQEEPKKPEAEIQTEDTPEQRQAEAPASSNVCHATCYNGRKAVMEWHGRKCKWANCKSCPECAESQDKDKSQEMSSPVEEEEAVSSRIKAEKAVLLEEGAEQTVENKDKTDKKEASAEAPVDWMSPITKGISWIMR